MFLFHRCRRIYSSAAPLAAAALLACLLPALHAQDHDGPHDNPAARQAWFLRGRRSPDRHPAAWHLRRAFQQRRAVRFAQRRVTRRAAAAPGMASFGGTTGSGAWKELGPRPLATSGSLAYAGGPPYQDYGDISGRATAIAIDPSDPTGNTVYAGAAYGGVWKSTNAMSPSPTFTPLTDSAPTLAVGAIAVDPSDPSTIFVGTGEPNDSGDSYYGEGILESSDGGKTWTQVTSADNGAPPARSAPAETPISSAPRSPSAAARFTRSLPMPTAAPPRRRPATAAPPAATPAWSNPPTAARPGRPSPCPTPPPPRAPRATSTARAPAPAPIPAKAITTKTSLPPPAAAAWWSAAWTFGARRPFPR